MGVQQLSGGGKELVNSSASPVPWASSAIGLISNNVQSFARNISYNFTMIFTACSNKTCQQRYNACLTAILQVNAGMPAPECQHLGFYWSKDDGGGNNWSYKMYGQTITPNFSRARYASCHPTNNVRAPKEASQSTDLLTPRSLGVLHLCRDH